MQNYKSYAAITLIANTFEILPEVGCRLPHSAVAEWMEHNHIKPEDVLYASPDVVKSKLVILASNNLPQIPNAA